MEITFGNTITKKTPVYADGELLGALYPKELVTYGLEDGGDVSLETIEQILKETLIPRAKRYAMNLLVKSDKTETELLRKLKSAGYGETAGQAALEYVRSFHYIDELRTAESYIRTKMDYSSEKEIRYKLEEKGINSETIDMAYDNITEDGTKEDPELKAALNFVRKKLGGRAEQEEELSYEEKQKIMAAAFRKGFRQESIKNALKTLNITY